MNTNEFIEIVPDIDALDEKILKLITKNARIPFLEVARECGVSGAAIHQRVQRLLNIGVVSGSEFIINPQKMGYNTCAYMGIYLDKATFHKKWWKNWKRFLKLWNVITLQDSMPFSSRCRPKPTNT